MRIYVIYDNRAKSFNTPFFQPSDVHAIRAFRTEVNRADPSNVMYLYPQEFDIRHIGEFHEATGTITPAEDASATLANGLHVKTEVK